MIIDIKELEERRYAAAELAGTNSCVDDERLARLFLKHREIAANLQHKWCPVHQLIEGQWELAIPIPGPLIPRILGRFCVAWRVLMGEVEIVL